MMSKDRGGTKEEARPLVSVVLPVHDGEDYLAAAMASILGQTYRHLELIVIDDGSSDSSAQIAASFTDPRVVLVRNERNLGLVPTLNRGLGLARGELVARMDADDVADPRRIEAQVERFLGDPGLVALGTAMQYIDAAGHVLDSPRRLAMRPAVVRWRLLRGTCVYHPTLMLHRARACEDARYSPEFVHAEDYELLLRLSRRHDLDNLAQPLLSQRLHERSVSTRFRDQQLESAARALVTHIQQCYGLDVGIEQATVVLEPRRYFDSALRRVPTPVASILEFEHRFLASERGMTEKDARDVRRDAAFFVWKLAALAITDWSGGAVVGRRARVIVSCAWALVRRPLATMAALTWR